MSGRYVSLLFEQTSFPNTEEHIYILPWIIDSYLCANYHRAIETQYALGWKRP